MFTQAQINQLHKLYQEYFQSKEDEADTILESCNQKAKAAGFTDEQILEWFDKEATNDIKVIEAKTGLTSKEIAKKLL